MDTTRFDVIAKLLAARRSRRAALRGLGAGLGVAAAAPLALRAAAQDATPAPSPTDPHPSADAPAQPEYLFVQSFAGGTWGPKEGEEGVYTLTLSGAAAQTVYFSDRPERIFGVAPMQEFLDRLGFTPANPPNAALVAQHAGGDDQEVLVIELLNPVYDEAAATLAYDARVLADYGEDGLAHAARQQTDFELPETFAEGGLFIDGLNDCSSSCGLCFKVVNGEKQIVGEMGVDYCSKNIFQCEVCDSDLKSAHYGVKCSETFPDKCSYTCTGTGCSWDCYVEKC